MESLKEIMLNIIKVTAAFIPIATAVILFFLLVLIVNSLTTF